MPSSGKPYRTYRGRRIGRPRRRVRSEDDVRLAVPHAGGSEAQEPPTDEHGGHPDDEVLDGLQADRPDDGLGEDVLDQYADPREPGALYEPISAEGGVSAGYAIVEPPEVEAPPPGPRPGALPPGRPPARRASPPRSPDDGSGGSRRGLRAAWSLTKWAFGLALLAAIACVAWAVIGFFVIRGGVNEANKRMDPQALAALSEPPGSALTTSRTILFLGVDTGGTRDGTGRADSIVLMRTDPDEHRISLLSIPRDLRVEVAGRGLDKINAAYAEGGAALLIRTVENLTTIPIHHVAVIDFDSFPEVIDAVGGVTIDVPAPIVSNRFDCPYPSQVRCDRWDGWRFEKGEQTMDGKRALIYSRVRENRLDESESDIVRGSRQQDVIRATADSLVSLRAFARLPFVGRNVTRPLTTDLTTSELFELAWVKFRTSDENVVQCRLGGSPSTIDGVSYIVGTPENAAVTNMFLGRAVPRKPAPGGGPFAPGCPVPGKRSAAESGG